MAFPISPSIGNQHVESGRRFEWDGQAWVLVQTNPSPLSTMVESNTVRNIVALTQAAYNALPTKDTETLYVII